ncbi:MAG: ABC transporter permease [Lachnospiraceae bacterium]
MHLYKHFWKLVWKNKSGIIIYGIIMIVMSVLVLFIANQEFSEPGEENFNKPVDISYVDMDQSVLSRGLIEYIGKNNNLSNYAGKDSEEINDLVFFTITSYHFEIPEGFAEQINAGEECNVEYRSFVSGASYIYSVSSAIDSYVNTYKTFMDMGMTEEEAVGMTAEVLDQEIDISIYSGKEDFVEGTAKDWSVYEVTLFFTYLSFGMITLTVGSVIIKTNGEQVSKRVEAGPVSRFKRSVIDSLGLYSAGLILWIISTAVMYIYGFDSNLVKERGIYICINTFIMILYNCSMTAFISSFRMKSEVLSMITNIVSLALSFLSGVFVPQWLLGDSILNVAKFFPFYWTVKSLNTIYSGSGSGFLFDTNAIFQYYGVGILFAATFFVLSIAVRKLKK